MPLVKFRPLDHKSSSPYRYSIKQVFHALSPLVYIFFNIDSVTQEFSDYSSVVLREFRKVKKIYFKRISVGSKNENIWSYVYNKAVIVVFSSKLSLWSIHFQDLLQSHEMAHYIPLLPVYVVYSLQTVEYYLGTFSPLNSLGICVQDMKSCPTHAVESSKMHNGFDTAVYRFKTRQLSLSHAFSIGFKSGNKLGHGMLAMFCWFLYSPMMRVQWGLAISSQSTMFQLLCPRFYVFQWWTL